MLPDFNGGDSANALEAANMLSETTNTETRGNKNINRFLNWSVNYSAFA